MRFQISFYYNDILYSFKRFKWKTLVAFSIYENDLLHFSISDLGRGLPDYTIEMRLTNSNKLVHSYILISKTKTVTPYVFSKINEQLKKHEFFDLKKPKRINENQKLKHNRFLDISLAKSARNGDLPNLNETTIETLLSQLKFIKRSVISLKFKSLNTEKFNYKSLKKSGLLIPANDFDVEEEVFAISLSIRSNKKQDLNRIGKYISNIFDVKLSRNYSMSIIGYDQTSFLNYGLVNFLKQVMASVANPKFDSIREKNNNTSISKVLVGLDIENNKFEVDLEEIKQGGIISGAIGTGKTTLRLTLMEQIMQKGITIMDIDYKGDAPRLYRFFSRGMVLVPGKNLHIDIFDQPPNVNSIEFIGILFRSFVESINDGDLTPPQKHILLDAIRKTVIKRGNLESFYRNIIIASVESKEIIENYQQQTAIALINKFNWLQSTMRNVFGVSGKSVSAEELAENNVFLDLSHIQHSAPNNHIRFFLDMLITKLMLYYKNQDSENFSQNNLTLRKVIFLDETHMFMPNQRAQNLSRLEELVVTLRHKGLSVIATTTNPAFISDVFLDSSFLAQFRTESSIMQRSLGLGNTEFKSIVQLPNYSFYLKSASTNYEPSILKTTQFFDNSLSLDEYDEVLAKYDVSYLDEFRIEPGFFEVALLESYIFNSLPIEPYRRIIRPIAKKYLIKYYQTIDKIAKENGYHQFLLQSYSDYFEDENGIPELKDQFYLRCFLYELLLMGFQYNFRTLALNKGTRNGGNSNFRKIYKVVFLNLIVFIDQFIDKQATEDIL